MNLLLVFALMTAQITEVQTDWVGGPGVLGPVPHWGNTFYESHNVTFNVELQLNPIATSVNYSDWVRHDIDIDPNIKHHNSIVPADFDGDEDLDLAGFVGKSGEIRVYKNQKVETGTPNFILQTTLTGIDPAGGTGYGDQWGIIWCGDLDGDGDPDIVVPGDGLWWFENTGGFNFTLHSISAATGYTYRSCTAGDIDNDGDVDIIAAGNFTTTDLYRNNNGTFQLETIDNDWAWWRLTLGDLNNDNYLDLLAVEDIYLNSYGNLSAPPDYTFPEWHDGQSIRDFNNDGKPDIMLAMYYKWIRWYENDGTGTNYTMHTVSSNPVGYADAAEATDLDMDGKADVVSCFTKVGFFKQISSDNFTEYVVEPSYNKAHWLTTANLDYAPCQGDADQDILASGEGMFTWWENRMVKKFISDAYLVSSILDAGDSATWQWFGWEVCKPQGTTLNFFIRTGKTPSETQSNPWYGPIPAQVGQPKDSVDISALVTQGDRYFQYKIEMGGGDLCPAVYEVWVKFLAEFRKDIGIAEIITPDKCLDPVPIRPCVSIENLGTAVVTTPVYCFIKEENTGKEVYEDEAEVTVSPGEREPVCFGEFTPDTGKSYTFRFEVPLDGDFNPTNNEVEKTFGPCHCPHDLATIRIIYPDTSDPWVPGNTDIRPKAWYYNAGDFPEDNYYLCAAILDPDGNIVYADSVSSDSLGTFQPNDTMKIEEGFKKWHTPDTSTQIPSYTAVFFTLLLPEDCYRKNDTMRLHFSIRPPGIGETSGKIGVFSLKVQGPIPSAHTTTISYSLPKATRVCLKVYDITGKVVNTLINKVQSMGSYSFIWDGNDKNGKRVPGGVYFISLETEEYKATRKVVLLKW